MWCKTIQSFFFCLLNLLLSSIFRLRRRRRGCSNSLDVQFLICDAGIFIEKAAIWLKTRVENDVLRYP